MLAANLESPRAIGAMPCPELGGYCLRALSGPLSGLVFAIDDRLEIGRREDAGVPLVTPGTSRRHATLVVEPDGITIVDHNSENGTWVGDTRVDQDRVTIGDLIRVDTSAFVVEYRTHALCVPRGPIDLP